MLEVDAASFGEDGDPFRPRPEYPHRHAAVVGMGPEDGVRIVMGSLDE
jgi:hypothetical protein